MTSPEFDLAAQMAAQTLGSQSMQDVQPALNEYLRKTQLEDENKIKKAILKTYLATPIEKRGQLDFESVISKMVTSISKDARKPWEEVKHPRNLYGQFIDKLGLDHAAFKNMPKVKAEETDGQRINGQLPFKIVHDTKSPKLPEHVNVPGQNYTQNEARVKAQEINESMAESRRRQLKGLTPDQYLKQVYNKDRRAGAKVVYSNEGEPIAYERGSAAIVSDLFGVLRIPETKEPGKPAHNLVADISTMAARGMGEARDSKISEWLKSKTAGAKALKAGAFLSGVFDRGAPSTRTKAFVDFVDAYGEDAGKQITRYYNRFTGISRPGGPDVNLTRGRDARGRKIDEGSDQGYRRRLYADLANRLPDNHAANLSRQAGAIPPSEGFVVAAHGGTIPVRVGKTTKFVKAEGQLVHQALGRANDHYLPFNISHLTALKGGGWTVRRRQWGGPTVEDLHTGLLTGASGVGTVSRHGVYEIEFTDLMKRAKNRMGPEHIRMVNRYESMLHAIREGKVQDETGRPVRLNHQGYTLALEALKAEFPWYIKNVEHTKSSPNAMRASGEKGKAVWKSDKIASDSEEDAGFASRREEFETDLADRVRSVGGVRLEGTRFGQAADRVVNRIENAGSNIEDQVRQAVDSQRGRYQSGYGAGWDSVTDSGPTAEEDIDGALDRFFTGMGEDPTDFSSKEKAEFLANHASEFDTFLQQDMDKGDRFVRDAETEPDATQALQNERVAMDQEDEYRRSLVSSLDALSNYDPENVTTLQVKDIEKHLRGAEASILALGAGVRKTQVDQYANFKRRFLKTMRAEGNEDYDV